MDKKDNIACFLLNAESRFKCPCRWMNVCDMALGETLWGREGDEDSDKLYFRMVTDKTKMALGCKHGAG